MGRRVVGDVAVGRPGDLTLPLVAEYVDEIRTVSEGSLSRALLLLLERAKLVVRGHADPTEPDGEALGLARAKAVAAVAGGFTAIRSRAASRLSPEKNLRSLLLMIRLPIWTWRHRRKRRLLLPPGAL